jgi:hypothetical protein
VCSYYLGAALLVLAVTGLFLVRGRNPAIIGGVALACWIFALGPNGLVFDWVKRVFPWIGVARYPVKFALFPVLLVPLLAAPAVAACEAGFRPKQLRLIAVLAGAMLLVMGGAVWFARAYPFPQDDWSATARNALGRALLAVALLAGLCWLPGLKHRAARLGLQVGLLAVLPLDALTHSPNIFPTLPASMLAPGFWTLSGKGAPPKLEEGRAMTSPEAEQYLQYSRVADRARDFACKRLPERNYLNLLDLVPSVSGMAMVGPSYYSQLHKHIYSPGGTNWSQGTLDLLGVAWFTSADNPLVLAQRTNHLPLISAGQRPMFLSDDQTLQAVVAAEFDPREVMYLPESAREIVEVTNRTVCTVMSARFSPHRVEAEVNAAEPSLVLISQSFYHLWQASIDGRPSPLLRADLAFEAVQVPAGKHRLNLTYRDRYLWIGVVITLFGLAAWGLAWIRSPRKDPQTYQELTNWR